MDRNTGENSVKLRHIGHDCPRRKQNTGNTLNENIPCLFNSIDKIPWILDSSYENSKIRESTVPGVPHELHLYIYHGLLAFHELWK